MSFFVIIFPPCTGARADFEAAVRRHLDQPEFIDAIIAAPGEPIIDAEQLPLWRWFTDS